MQVILPQSWNHSNWGKAPYLGCVIYDGSRDFPKDR